MDSAWHSDPYSSARDVDVITWLETHVGLRTEVIAEAEALSKELRLPLLVALNRAGSVDDEQLVNALAHVAHLPVITFEEAASVANVNETLSTEFLRRNLSLMTTQPGRVLMVDPTNFSTVRALTYALGHPPDIAIIRAGDWRRLFSSLHDDQIDLSAIQSGDETSSAKTLATQERDAPIVRLIGSWLNDAADQGASDVHIDARRSGVEVRFRKDGALGLIAVEPKNVASSVIARIKVLAGLDLGERNRSQDGRATLVVRGRRLDVRVSIITTIDGESAVIRLLDRPTKLLDTQSLGFGLDVCAALETIAESKHGLFVVAGSTGSGKTTTLYAMLNRLQGKGLKILSVEDPVEYHFDHVDQVQVSEKSGRTFASTLRSFLRHDPDVILVGEIRDTETARIAVQAALTGHLVLATLHAIDTSRVRERLLDLGVEPFQLDACLIGSMAQRLIRKLCPKCSRPAALSDEDRKRFIKASVPAPPTVRGAAGCQHCSDQGYFGRVPIAEVSLVTGKTTDPLEKSCLELVAEGQTSLAEAIETAGS